VRQIRMLRAMRRELETGLRRLLNGHAGANPGHGQEAAYGLPRQFPTLPGYSLRGETRQAQSTPGPQRDLPGKSVRPLQTPRRLAQRAAPGYAFTPEAT